MPSEVHLPGSPDNWLRYAHSDLELARIEKPPDVLLESLCFHAQQAAEKALKAVLIAKDIPFPKTHNIRTLLDLLPEDVNTSSAIIDGAILTDYAVTIRYPGNIEPVDEEEYQKAVRLAETIVCWSEEIIQKFFREKGDNLEKQ